jgi:hypothetical protein
MIQLYVEMGDINGAKNTHKYMLEKFEKNVIDEYKDYISLFENELMKIKIKENPFYNIRDDYFKNNECSIIKLKERFKWKNLKNVVIYLGVLIISLYLLKRRSGFVINVYKFISKLIF